MVHDLTSVSEGGRGAIPYVFVKCAKHQENKRVAGKFKESVCIKCAEGDEKKGDRRIARREGGEVVREVHSEW